ncbi:MAG: methyltransferase domain-containing protein [Alphaproteobacteria bacterium]|nr:methyltransferase domain-containing protein [Alphaproteobacteria bacterium]
MVDSIKQARQRYAEELRFTARVSSHEVVAAFASVPRERFVGLGPWRVRSPMNMSEYWTTEDADPRHVYHDVLIALDEARGINNGQPSLWALLFDQLDIVANDAVLHLGCGTGYYTAIVAELAGPANKITAVEIDPDLAERARAALKPWPQVTVSNVDGARAMFDGVDVIIASAGATHPLSSWLDALNPCGRLMFPMTTTREVPGAMLLVVRQGEEAFAARFIHRVGFIPFQGARNQGTSQRLAAALRRDWGAGVRSLRRDQHPKADTCWLHAKNWCLSRALPANAGPMTP